MDEFFQQRNVPVSTTNFVFSIFLLFKSFGLLYAIIFSNPSFSHTLFLASSKYFWLRASCLSLSFLARHLHFPPSTPLPSSYFFVDAIMSSSVGGKPGSLTRATVCVFTCV